MCFIRMLGLATSRNQYQASSAFTHQPWLAWSTPARLKLYGSFERLRAWGSMKSYVPVSTDAIMSDKNVVESNLCVMDGQLVMNNDRRTRLITAACRVNSLKAAGVHLVLSFSTWHGWWEWLLLCGHRRTSTIVSNHISSPTCKSCLHSEYVCANVQ